MAELAKNKNFDTRGQKVSPSLGPKVIQLYDAIHHCVIAIFLWCFFLNIPSFKYFCISWQSIYYMIALNRGKIKCLGTTLIISNTILNRYLL